MHHYRRFLAMVVLSFVAMFVLMYAMVDQLANALPNLNQIYMAGLMAAAMVILELALMGSMYPDKKLNAVLLAGSVVIPGACWWGIRAQAAIGDAQFLRSMIPHHAGAILMCQQAEIRSDDIRKLCEGIVSGQQSEIAQMKALLEQDDR